MHAGRLPREVALSPVGCRTRRFPGPELQTHLPRHLFPLPSIAMPGNCSPSTASGRLRGLSTFTTLAPLLALIWHPGRPDARCQFCSIWIAGRCDARLQASSHEPGSSESVSLSDSGETIFTN